jgi:hypothetical protein
MHGSMNIKFVEEIRRQKNDIKNDLKKKVIGLQTVDLG